MNNALVIDGHNFLFKSFAVPFKFYSKKGTPLHVVTTFISLLKCANSITNFPNKIIVVFDSETKTIKSKLNREYKANRRIDYSNLDDSPFVHLPLIKKVLNYLKVEWIEYDGYEADEVIASTASTLLKLRLEKVTIASNDSDFFQLLTDRRIEVLRIINKKNVYICNKDWFLKTFGFSPSKYVLYKSYVGDSTDNIKGIKSIGKVRATEIIRGDREVILTNTQRRTLNINRKLIRLDKGIKIDVKFNQETTTLQNVTITKVFDDCKF